MEDLLELSLAKDKFQYSQSSILHDPSSTLIPIIIFSPLRILVAEPARKAPISHTQPHTQLPFVSVIPFPTSRDIPSGLTTTALGVQVGCQKTPRPLKSPQTAK